MLAIQIVLLALSIALCIGEREKVEGVRPCRGGLLVCSAHCQIRYGKHLLGADCQERSDAEGKKNKLCICRVSKDCHECKEKQTTINTDFVTTPMVPTMRSSTIIPQTVNQQSTNQKTTTTLPVTTPIAQTTLVTSPVATTRPVTTPVAPTTPELKITTTSRITTEKSEPESTTKKGTGSQSGGGQSQSQSQNQNININTNVDGGGKAGVNVSSGQKQTQQQGNGGNAGASGLGGQKQSQNQTTNISINVDGGDGGPEYENQDCAVGNWEKYGECSVTCGEGAQSYVRTVLRPSKGNGAICPPLSKAEKCNEDPCQTDGCNYGQWQPWMECSATCGVGAKVRTRASSSNAESCPPKVEVTACNLLPRCGGPLVEPIDCIVSPWSPWSSCSQTCGGGSKRRQRTIVRKAVNNGEECPDDFSQTEGCNNAECEDSDDNDRSGSRRRCRGSGSGSDSGECKRRRGHKSKGKGKSKSKSRSGSKEKSKGKGKHRRHRHRHRHRHQKHKSHEHS